MRSFFMLNIFHVLRDFVLCDFNLRETEKEMETEKQVPWIAALPKCH